MTQNVLPTTEALQILQAMTDGYRLSQLIYVIAKLEIPDLLAARPMGATELAAETDCHPGMLERVLRGLASAGVLAESEGGIYTLTPVGAGLRSGVPGSYRDVAILFNEQPYLAWGSLLAAVRTGAVAFELAFGTGYFPYVAQHPEAAAVFNAAMTGRAAMGNRAIVEAFDFSKYGTIIDIGGGQGSLLGAVLAAHPSARGLLFDLPDVVAGAGPVLSAVGVADRCNVVGGDFFVEVPAGGDLYILSRVIHDWDDERSVAILRNCRKVLHPAARLALVEVVMPAATVVTDGNFLHPAYSLDLHMMAITGGCERTEAQFRELFAQAGLEHARTVQTAVGIGVVEAKPV